MIAILALVLISLSVDSIVSLPISHILCCLAYGILFVMPIGGADMPVVISLLNSFTGLAAAFAGFLYGNMVMLTGGILVGSAGTILTFAMCDAMNRPLSSVIFGAFGEGTAGSDASQKSSQGSIKKTTPSDAAILLNYANQGDYSTWLRLGRGPGPTCNS